MMGCISGCAQTAKKLGRERGLNIFMMIENFNFLVAIKCMKCQGVLYFTDTDIAGPKPQTTKKCTCPNELTIKRITEKQYDISATDTRYIEVITEVKGSRARFSLLEY